MRYRYLGEELVNDVLLESHYSSSIKDDQRLAKDLRKLGFGRDLKELENIVRKFREENSSVVSMEEVLKPDDRFFAKMRLSCNADFRGFYLEYIRDKREKADA